MSPLDPRLERHKPALVYDPQEAYRAMSAASITDNRDNALKRDNGAVVSRAGSGLTLDAARDATTSRTATGSTRPATTSPPPAASRATPPTASASTGA